MVPVAEDARSQRQSGATWWYDDRVMRRHGGNGYLKRFAWFHAASEGSPKAGSRWRFAAVALVAAGCVGLLVQPAARVVARSSTYESLEVFSSVLAHVRNTYIEEVDPRELIYGAVRGMISTLDPHSSFMSPDEYEQMVVDTGGEFGGIGLEVSRKEDDLVVVAPLENTPSYRAGLQPGDVIVAIDGEDALGIDLARAASMLRGPPGTTVILRIDRSGFLEPREVPVVREQIKINPVSGRLVDSAAVIRIKSFQEGTRKYTRRELDRLRKDAGGEFAGLVLDLRNNPGGLLEQAVGVVDLWLSEGVIVVTRGRGDSEQVREARRSEAEPDYPMIVLVNEGSASASEIVAGALRDHGRAVLMGVGTFGKGSVQTLIDLEDGSGLKLTVARYYTPSGEPIGAGGLEPDVLVEALESADAPAASEDEEDPQLKAALDSLQSGDLFRASEEAAGDGTER